VLREWDEKERARQKPMPEKPIPLPGLEPKTQIISTSGQSSQILEMLKV
jgi:hypothetical protein